MYSQNNEEEIVLAYFGSRIGNLLDIGANDGITLSNSRALMEAGWSGTLVEPSREAVARLKKLYGDNDGACVLELAVGDSNDTMDLMDSGTHLNKGDVSLLSTLSNADYEKWKDTTTWSTYEVEMVDFQTLLDRSAIKHFDFITIDAEGLDLVILRQIDLSKTDCVCVEHNGKDIDSYINYCAGFGLVESARNAENIIFTR